MYTRCTHAASREPPSSKSRGQTIIIFEELTKSKRLFKGSRCQATWNAAASAPPIVSWFSSLSSSSLSSCFSVHRRLFSSFPLSSVSSYPPFAHVLSDVHQCTRLPCPLCFSVLSSSFRFLFRLSWFLHFFVPFFPFYPFMIATSSFFFISFFYASIFMHRQSIHVIDSLIVSTITSSLFNFLLLPFIKIFILHMPFNFKMCCIIIEQSQ